MTPFTRVGCLVVLLAGTSAQAAGDIGRGAKVFGACAACHSLAPGRHLTGPSLAGIWDRKAGALADFMRYSPVLKRSALVWNAASLDAWVKRPDALLPGNYMDFAGIPDARARADLLAYLQAVSAGRVPAGAGMRALPDLKQAPAANMVKSIRHCRDTYFLSDGNGETRPYWEFNLRFKTDSGASGPTPGRPVMVGQGMQGDRAQVVFSRPEEISAFIQEGC